LTSPGGEGAITIAGIWQVTSANLPEWFTFKVAQNTGGTLTPSKPASFWITRLG
jgi:hypothetical protein